MLGLLGPWVYCFVYVCVAMDMLKGGKYGSCKVWLLRVCGRVWYGMLVAGRDLDVDLKL